MIQQPSRRPVTSSNWLIQQDQACRRVVTRYDKFAANYLAFIQLASIRLRLRVGESAPWQHLQRQKSPVPDHTAGAD
jgi:hypothetical protein